jgi:hypothetical protein
VLEATVDTPAGELHVRAPMGRIGNGVFPDAWYVSGTIEVAASADGPWRPLRADWHGDAEDALRREAAARATAAIEERAEAWR